MSFRSMVLLTLAGAGAVGSLAGCSQSSRRSGQTGSDSVEIGYGAQPKEKVTGAVTSIERPDASRPLQIEQLLKGRVSGLQVVQRGDRVSVRIRGGNRSMVAGTVEQDALVIVDGVMIQDGNIANALAGLTADDIRKVDVLKDVASTSVYGSRGAGGVIIITTNRNR